MQFKQTPAENVRRSREYPESHEIIYSQTYNSESNDKFARNLIWPTPAAQFHIAKYTNIAIVYAEE